MTLQDIRPTDEELHLELPTTKKRFRPHQVILAAALILTVVTRVAYLLSNRVLFDADEATTGIMVRQILHGHFYTFFAGQNYGGTIEQYLEAIVYFVLRLPQNPLTLRLPLVAISIGTCYLTYLFARRILGPTRGAIAALLFAVVPWFNVVGTTTSLGFYVAGQLFGIAVLYLALRVSESNGRSALVNLCFGICCGLALWTSLTCLYEVIPAVLWVAPVITRKGRDGLIGFAIGFAPQWISSLVGGHLPFPGPPHRSTSVAERLGNLFGPVGREYLGLTYNYAAGGLPLWLQWFIEIGAISLLALAVFKRRSGISRLLRLKKSERFPVDMLLVMSGVVVIMYVVSSSTWFVGQPRYLLSTYPALMIGLASLLPSRISLRPVFIATAFAGLATGCCAGYFVTQTVTPTTQQQDATMDKVIALLAKRDERFVYAGYWTAIPLQYFAGNRLEVATCYGAIRFSALQHAVESHHDPVYIGSSLDGTTRRILDALHLHHAHFRATRIGFIEVFDHLPASATPRHLIDAYRPVS